MNGLTKLRELLKANIDRFNIESQKHKDLHRTCATSTIVLTAATTIVASLGLILAKSHGRTLQFAVVVLTATTTAVAAWAEMRRARDLWQHERELDFRATIEELSEKDLNQYFRRVAAVLGSSSEKWTRIQEKKAAEQVNGADV